MINYRNGRETMKVIVKPVGPHMYINAPYGEEIRPNRPSVVIHSPFVDVLIARGDLKLFATGLPMKAEDAGFFDAYIESEKDEKLAVEAFCSEFGIDPQGEEVDTETTQEVIEELDKLSYADLKIRATEMGIEFKGNVSTVDLKALIKEAGEKDETDEIVIPEEDQPVLQELKEALEDGLEVSASSVREDGVIIFTILNVETKEEILVDTLLNLYEVFVKKPE